MRAALVISIILISVVSKAQDDFHVFIPDDSTVMTLIYDPSYKTPETFELSNYYDRFKGQILQTYYSCLDTLSVNNPEVKSYARRLKYQLYQVIEDGQYVYYDMLDTSGLDRKSIIHRYPKCQFMNIEWDNHEIENRLVRKFENIEDTVLTVNTALTSFDYESLGHYYFEKVVDIGYLNPGLNVEEVTLGFNDLWWEDYGSQKGSGELSYFQLISSRQKKLL